MLKRLALFTTVTFLVYFALGLLSYYYIKRPLAIYIVLSIVFVLLNFFYYYQTLIKTAETINEEFERLSEEGRINMLEEIKTPGMPAVERFFNAFKDFMNTTVSELITAAGKASVFNAKFRHELVKAIDELNENMNSFDAVITTMNDSAKAISDISNSVEEFTGFMHNVEEASKVAMDIINKVEEDIRTNIEMMGEGRKLIDELDVNLKNINGIVGVINEIADQTNLLALNAAIEAARAGEAGRGFAVVADEVRKLAEKTRQNASEINEMIDTVSANASRLISQNREIAERIQESGESAERIRETFEKLVSEIDQASQMLNNITAAVEEQSASVEEVTQTVEHAVGSTKEIVEKLNSISKESSDLSDVASKAFEMLQKLKINHPLEEIYAILKEGKQRIEKVIDDALKSGEITPEDIWDRNYVPVPGTNPQKYRTRFTDFVKKRIQPIEDELLSKHPRFKFVALVDDHGYLPAHNSIYDKPLTGDYEKDLVGNRSMRIFDDPTGLAAAKNTEPLLIQTYMRDTGNAMYDISIPIYVQGKHWGGLRSGVTP